MSLALHFSWGTVPGYGPPDGCRYPPCTGVFGRAVKVSTCLHNNVYRSLSLGMIASRKYGTVEATFLCRADSRRNSDFSKHNGRGFSRTSGNRDGSEFLSSKNGPVLPPSNNPKLSATAVPGPGEKEIVKILRKVQAKLREGAFIKEQTKIEPLQTRSKETEAVDSLLKLLKKHAVEHGKRKSIHDSSSSGESQLGYSLDQPKGPKQNEDKSPILFGSNSTMQEVSPEGSTSPARPVSKFRHKSPIPQNKVATSFSEKTTAKSFPLLNSGGHSRECLVDTHLDPEVEVEVEPEAKSEPEVKPEPEKSFSNELVFEDPEIVDEDDEDDLDDILDETDDIVDEIDDDEVDDDDDNNILDEIDDGDDDGKYVEDRKELGQCRDMTALKVSELRSLTKSLGVKGFSKMKKAELVEVLSGYSI